MDHEPRCGCDCANCKVFFEYLTEYTAKLESGVLQLFHLCKDGSQDNGAASWELLKALAMTASQNDLRGYLTGLDGGMSGARAVMLRAANRLH